jgi:uncharacterized oligopeptide transporter (OPT) family protein
MHAVPAIQRVGRYVAIVIGSLLIAFVVAILAEVAGINMAPLAE